MRTFGFLIKKLGPKIVQNPVQIPVFWVLEEILRWTDQRNLFLNLHTSPQQSFVEKIRQKLTDVGQKQKSLNF